jgi:hypothetical protein
MLRKKKGYTPSQNILIFGVILLIIFAFISVPMYKLAKQKSTVTNLRVLDSLFLQSAYYHFSSTSDFPNFYETELTPKEFGKIYFTPYLSATKKCEKDQSECWSTPTYVDLTNQPVNLNIEYSLNLENKSVLGFYKSKNGLMTIIIDINGKVGENKLGKDVFIYTVFNNQYNKNLCKKEKGQAEAIQNGLHAGGVDKCGLPQDRLNYSELLSKDTADGCNKKSKFNEFGVGAACAAVIKSSSWRIDSVYPW